MERRRDPFQQTFNACTDSDGLGWVELQMDSLQALGVMSMVVFILLSAELQVSVKYFEEYMEDILTKESTFRLQRNFTFANF